MCQRAYIANEGKIIAEGSTQEILQNEEVRKVYLGDRFTL
ncbi:MAG: hypothetical protein EBX40_03670 [Gammaproteobacteria bacterium]|nr:hypothetical protein [Gammaproteobacteria bacterium]